jgi:hypothetical protein
MVELTLRLPSLRVLDKLLPLLQQLNISYQTRTIEPPVVDLTKQEAVFAKINAGVLSFPNLEETMRDFEESRQDNVLFGRD